jgi:hypothetical protein
MKTKIVYTVSSNENDSYLEQTLMSIYSLKVHNPNAEIILLVDDLTDNTITGKRNNILKLISSKIVVFIEGKYTNMQRSRILKTIMREYVEGDFLYIDNDTIITAPLDEIDDFSYDIGAVKELHISLKEQYDLVLINRNIKKLGMTIGSNSDYFNSGVIFTRDNIKARKFFKDWNTHWHQGKENGINIDMPSMAVANMMNNNIMHELSGTWNCQLYWGLKYLHQSKIIHYFSSNLPFHEGSLAKFTDINFQLRLKQIGEVNEQMSCVLKNPHKYFNEKTMIIYGGDIGFWNSFFVRFSRYLYRKHTKLFSMINIICRCIFITVHSCK